MSYQHNNTVRYAKELPSWESYTKQWSIQHRRVIARNISRSTTNRKMQ